MRLFIFLCAAALVTLMPRSAKAESIVMGRASVIDGDTIEIKGERIRLNGIDAPESAQLCSNSEGQQYRCGKVSAQILDELLAGSRPTRCEYVERDRYGRFVGDCYRNDGRSVAELLVLSGWALDWPRYSKKEYADEHAQAKASRHGLWAGTFTPPWEWRAGRRASRAAKPQNDAN
jgi:endonuclease YncB( thermonuclease family)